MSRFRVFAIGLVLAAAVFPCAIDDSPRFVPGRIPEKVDARFVRGELGILTPDLGARYQLIAWRYLAGMPLSSDEQAALVTKPADTADAALNQWQTATSNTRFLDRSKSSRVAPNEYYVNCLDDAFLTATATLADRRTKYGNDGNDALTRNWIAAQDQVFSNCSAREPAYPADPDASMPPLARADRMYQIAAAHFYAEDFDGARERFEAIARTRARPGGLRLGT